MNIKRMEYMIEDLNESLQNHLMSVKNTYYYVMQQNAGKGELAVKVYTLGGEIECECICMPDYKTEGEVVCTIIVDGEKADERKGIMSVNKLSLAKGYHTIEFATSENTASSRVRLTGAIRESGILSL